jgi:hypothetical protein
MDAPLVALAAWIVVALFIASAVSARAYQRSVNRDARRW